MYIALSPRYIRRRWGDKEKKRHARMEREKLEREREKVREGERENDEQ